MDTEISTQTPAAAEQTKAAQIDPGKYFLDAQGKSKWEQAVEHFRNEMVPQLEKAYGSKLNVETYPIQSEKYGDKYAIHAVHVPAQEEKKGLITILVATHGVEGGLCYPQVSAFIDQHINPDNAASPAIDFKKYGLLIIPDVNPYGFDNDRRWTENNVDLNRNGPREGFEGREKLNPDYGLVEERINPKVPPATSAARETWFKISMGATNLIEGEAKTKGAVLTGQHRNPDGLFFGGNDYEANTVVAKQIFDKHSQGYQGVLLMDIHSGYGPKGKISLYDVFDSGSNTTEHDAVHKQIFGPVGGTIPENNNEPGQYVKAGEITEYLSDRKQNVWPVVVETGTLGISTLSKLESLERVVSEHALARLPKPDYKQHGINDEKAQAIRQSHAELFAPTDPETRKTIMAAAPGLLKNLVSNFQAALK